MNIILKRRFEHEPLSEAAKRRGLSVTALASEAGFRVDIISRILNGTRSPTEKQLQVLCGILGVPMDVCVR